MTATLSQRSDSTVRTNSDESLHINTTTDTTSYSRYSVNNGNENGHTDPTSVNTYHTTYPESLSNQDWSVIISGYVYVFMFLRECTLQIIRNAV